MPPIRPRLPEPYWKSPDGHHALYHGDCLKILPLLGKVDAVVTDPPYGVGKAEWDDSFPTEWFPLARELGETVYTMIGVSTIPLCIKTVGGDFQDMVAIWLSNGMTRGPLGFGNWIPVVVSQKERKFLGGQNAFKVVVDTRENIDHPSPKPFTSMVKLLETNKDAKAILDPFTGSGTTGVAAIRLKRRFIGIEIEEKYCRVAARRLQEEWERMERLRIAEQNYHNLNSLFD